VLVTGEAVPGADVGDRPLPERLPGGLIHEANTAELTLQVKGIESRQRPQQRIVEIAEDARGRMVGCNFVSQGD